MRIHDLAKKLKSSETVNTCLRFRAVLFWKIKYSNQCFEIYWIQWNGLGSQIKGWSIAIERSWAGNYAGIHKGSRGRNWNTWKMFLFFIIFSNVQEYAKKNEEKEIVKP